MISLNIPGDSEISVDARDQSILLVAGELEASTRSRGRRAYYRLIANVNLYYALTRTTR